MEPIELVAAESGDTGASGRVRVAVRVVAEDVAVVVVVVVDGGTTVGVPGV